MPSTVRKFADHATLSTQSRRERISMKTAGTTVNAIVDLGVRWVNTADYGSDGREHRRLRHRLKPFQQPFRFVYANKRSPIVC